MIHSSSTPPQIRAATHDVSAQVEGWLGEALPVSVKLELKCVKAGRRTQARHSRQDGVASPSRRFILGEGEGALSRSCIRCRPPMLSQNDLAPQITRKSGQIG